MQLAEFSRGISTFGAIFGSVTIGCLYIASLGLAQYSVSQAHYMMILYCSCVGDLLQEIF